jgi:hypothetical protein
VKEDSFNQQQGLASGTGNNSYSHNYYQKKAYDPDNDVSVVSYDPAVGFKGWSHLFFEVL